MARRQPTQVIRPTQDALPAFPSGRDRTIQGTDFNDTLYGGLTEDLLIGGNGDDQLFGGDGKDKLEGGNGNDTLWGESGWNNLYGGNGDDQLFGGNEFDNINGGLGNDILWATSGGDLMYGDEGNDQLFGGNDSNIRMSGGDGNDTLWGEGGDDKIFGNFGNDQLLGGSGNDLLYGGAGNNYLDGFGGGSQEIDILSSARNNDGDVNGIGSETFALGNSTGAYYQSGGSDTEDFSYAIIRYFSVADDFIQVSGIAGNYELVFEEFSGNGIQDTGIYLGDDLIAVVDDTTDVIIDRDFIFV